MKKLLFFLTTLFIFSCGYSSDINKVKNHYFEEYDSTISVGKLFDNYKDFSKIEWKSFESSGRKIIQATCYIKKNKIDETIIRVNEYYNDFNNNEFLKIINSSEFKAAENQKIVYNDINKDTFRLIIQFKVGNNNVELDYVGWEFNVLSLDKLIEVNGSIIDFMSIYDRSLELPYIFTYEDYFKMFKING